jgi:hypothetical protein
MKTFEPETDVLRRWLDDGPSPADLPDSIYGAVMDRVPEVRQRRGPWPALPFPVMRMVAGVGMAAAVVVLAVWAVANAPHSLDFTGVGPEPTSSQDAEQAAVRQTLRYWAGQEIPAGTYFIDDPFRMRIAVTVPSGMEATSVTTGLAGLCSPTCDPELAGIDFWIVENGYEDACQPGQPSDPPLGPGVDAFIDFLRTHERLTVGDPVDVTVAGYDGVYVETVADSDLSDCTNGLLRLFYNTPGQIFFRHVAAGGTDRFWVLDVDGTRLVIDAFSVPGTPEDQIAALERVVESIRIETVYPPSAPTN